MPNNNGYSEPGLKPLMRDGPIGLTNSAPGAECNLVVGEDMLRRLLREELRGELRQALSEMLPVEPAPQCLSSKMQETDFDRRPEERTPGGSIDCEVDTDTSTAATATAEVNQNAIVVKCASVDEEKKDDSYKLQKLQTSEKLSETPSFSQIVKKVTPDWINNYFIWIMQIKEPKRTGRLAEFARSGRFEAVCAMVIVANAAFSFFSTNYEMEHRGEVMPGSALVEAAFVVAYCIELGVRLSVHRWYFFCNQNMSWNIFDLLLVCIAAYNQTLGLMVGGQSEMRNLNYMRTLRLLRMTKVLRVLRIMKCISELRLILNSLLGSMLSLFWSIVTMCLMFYIFGLLFVQTTITYLQGTTPDSDTEDRIYNAFGTVQIAMLSLFKATTGGCDWQVFYDLLSPMGFQAASLYLFFIAFSQIAFMNILTGLFVDSALKLSEPDRQQMVSEGRRAFARQRKELEDVMEEMDLDGNGRISEEEFHAEMRLQNGKLPVYLESVGVNQADAERFFSMLKSASMGQEVEISGFVDGCLKLQGDASSLDLQAVAFQVKSVHKEIYDLNAELQKVQKAIRAGRAHDWGV